MSQQPQQTVPSAPDSPALVVTSNVQKYAIKKKKVLSAEETELFELTQAAGITVDQEVFKWVSHNQCSTFTNTAQKYNWWYKYCTFPFHAALIFSSFTCQRENLVFLLHYIYLKELDNIIDSLFTLSSKSGKYLLAPAF